MSSFRPSGLQSVSLIYGLLYLVFIALATIPSTRPGIIGGLRPESVGLELAFAQLLFLLFLVGCAAAWQSELITGLIFLLWYAFVWWGESFSRRYGAGGGGMPQVLGFPVFILGILFIGRWFLNWLSKRPLAQGK